MEASLMQFANEVICEGSQRKGRSKNFSIQEDMLLISAWENVSLVAIKDYNNQMQLQTIAYWSRIKSYYDEHKSFTSERTSTALTNRWCTIQKSVTKFQEFYNQIEEGNQSGMSEEDKVRQALQMYQSMQGSAFAFLHCWTKLRNSSKFASNLSKKNVKVIPNDDTHTISFSQSPLSVDCEEENEDGLERSTGRKAVEKRKRMASEPHNEALKTFFTSIRDHMSTSANNRREEYETMLKLEEEHLELKRKQVRITEAREKREQQAYETSIMAIDTTKLEPQIASYLHSLKAEIHKRREDYETMITIEEEQLELKRKQLRINESREKRERQVYEASIIAMDTTEMEPQMASYFNSLKAEILGKIK